MLADFIIEQSPATIPAGIGIEHVKIASGKLMTVGIVVELDEFLMILGGIRHRKKQLPGGIAGGRNFLEDRSRDR